MGRSPSITIGDTSAGLRVEHVKSRGLVRLVRWTAGRVEDDVVGVEVSDFCARLGLTTDVLGPSHRYLLVAGAARAGAGHTVALFGTESQARTAFVNMRRADPGSDAWAEVTELITGGNVRRVCWYGTTGIAIAEAPVQRRRRRLPQIVVWGSRASRRPLPTKLTASTVTRMARPGA